MKINIGIINLNFFKELKLYLIILYYHNKIDHCIRTKSQITKSKSQTSYEEHENKLKKILS